MEVENREKLLEEFYVNYHNENYADAIELLKEVMHCEKKKSFWCYSRLSSCYYELRDYEQALANAKIAYKLEPNSPLVLWDYAGVLIMVKKEEKAIKLLSKIQEMDNDLTIYGYPKPNKSWMKSLKIDANFLIGKANYIIRKDKLATEYFLKYLYQRRKGIKTIYSKKLVSDYLKKLTPTVSEP